jgi:hypothetical protein
MKQIRSAAGTSWIWAAALALIPFIYFYPAILGKVTLAPGDGWGQIFGIRILIGELLAKGEGPFWNPYIFGGSPLLASLQPAALYPPTWIFAFLSPRAAMNLMVITTYHLALVGTYLFARRIGLNRSGALVAGVAFTFGGYMVVHLGHTSRIATAAWLPWILLAIEELYQRARWRWIALGAFFLALQTFAGEPQMNFYTYMVAGAYGLFSLTLREQQEQRFRSTVALVVMCVCGAMFSMAQLIPAREMLALGERASIGYDYFAGFSLPPRQTLGFLMPYFFGGAASDPYAVTYWGEWNPPETIGYVGLLPLLMGMVALIGARNRQTVFWGLVAGGALLLAFGSYLPFDLYRVMYRVPGYNLFRASGRNLFEFTFAIGILAGIGVTTLASLERRKARQVLSISVAILGAAMGVATIIYLFFLNRLTTKTPLPETAGFARNPDLWIPLLFFVLSVLAAYVYVRGRQTLAGVILVVVLLADAMSWSLAFEWTIVTTDVARSLQDSPSVKFIKEREPDLNSFRFFSYSSEPFGRNTELLNYPNFPITRGLQSLNGYDPLRLEAVASVAGALTLEGLPAQKEVFGLNHRGLDLFNVRYLLYEREDPKLAGGFNQYENIQFSRRPLGISLQKGAEEGMEVKATATEISIISEMGVSTHLENGAPVVSIILHTADGKTIERDLLVGRDTSEWAYDREDVRAAIKHDRAKVVESWPVDGFDGHRYLARLPFERAEIVHVEFKYKADSARIKVSAITFFDAATGVSQPFDSLFLSPKRWRELTRWGDVGLYENLKSQPRVWFVRRAELTPRADMLQTIQTGRLRNGEPFDPAETVLLESELFPPERPQWPSTTESKGEARLVRYKPNQIELVARNSETGILVLSEPYYRGWEARIDGVKTSIERVNYTFRGVVVPPGEHRVEFRFRSPSIRKGAIFFALGIMILGVGAWLRPMTRS